MEFMKLQALGNDFLLIEGSAAGPAAGYGSLAVRLCDRHFGAGADGVVVVSQAAPGSGADASTRIFNADGGEAEVSGNGTRCVAAYLRATGRWAADAGPIRIGTAAGVKTVRLAGDGSYETEMGAPRLASAEVPAAVDPPLERVVGHELALGDERLVVTVTSIGNPHCTTFVDDVEAVDWRRLGPLVERHPLFPKRTNVEFVQVLGPDRIRVRFWERGAGETLSSGTGASAATVASVLNGLTNRSVAVETPAGELRVRWREEDDLVLLAGPAEPVYSGVWIG